MDGQKSWKDQAIELQMQYFETLGSRPFDKIKKTDLFLLKKKIGFATCGKPSELPNSTNYNTGYKKDELDHIKKICDQIIAKSDCDPIKFACTVLILHYKDVCCESPVFRIVTEAENNIFIDANSRVYQNWEHFMTNNQLPACEYCYPLNGEYTVNSTENLIGFALSPATSLMSKTADCLDTVGSIASIGAGSVFLLGTFCTVAPVVATVAGGTALCTGAYSVVRGGGTLYDRSKHEQSISVTDREARSAWLSVGSSALGAATVCALGAAKNIYESGKSLSKLATFSLHALTATSVAFSGFGFVETLLICNEKYQKGVLSKQDVFDLTCELMFLFNAIASAKATTSFVNQMAIVVEAPTSQKLTKTQKRNIRKRAAKRRAKGIVPVVKEEAHGIKLSSTIQVLIFEAIKAYAPRVEEIRYTCQSIGHDIQCWKAKEISEVILINNLVGHFTHLYNYYREEITEVVIKVVKYFSSTFDKINELIFVLFETCSVEMRTLFCTRIINLEDQLDVVINDAETEGTQLYESLEIQNVQQNYEVETTATEDYERSAEDELYPEAQRLLSVCEEVIVQSSWSFNDIQEFSDILECVKCVAVSDFKGKIANYKKALEAAKSVSGDSFDISTYHKALGIRGDVEQHMFSEALKDSMVASNIYRMKKMCKELKKERSVTTPVWEAVNDGMFHYYGPHGAGDLDDNELLPIITSAINKDFKDKDLTKENSSWKKEKDIIIVQMNDDPDTVIIVYTGITEENTASGVIMVVK